ncbi:unnamed protein product [Hymenolepis diminuta]|uniref:Replication termination factor 2 n=1 Tax=Hymenolepis diminuta TaxID=6216 RepID=A0A0R3SCB5_HYMDI|nr:unnamed protein product [Hymenolepis diminuta]VUZ40881.1 unnamed protein product [Hymenolepis diminuta]
MGGDGGSIPRRVELVREKKQKEKVGKIAADAAKWKHCALSQQPLRQPIVACQLGRLYNKEAIIEKLLDPTKYTSSVADHIKKLKDVRDLRLTPIPKEQISHELSSGIIEDSAESFCCPILGQEMNGSYPFVFSWECGCVVSKRAFDNVKDSSCLKCGKPLKPESVILLNPETDEDIRAAQERLRTYKEAIKKSKKNHTKLELKTLPDAESDKKPVKVGDKRSADHVPSTLSSHKRVKKEDGDCEGKKKSDHEHVELDNKKKAPGSSKYSSVQNDPNASTVFKSLFTTSEEAKNQPKSHWVTFNPLYFH